MVLPLFDDNSDRRSTPVINWVLIALNFFVFIVLQSAGDETNHFTYAFCTVPEEIVTGHDIATADRVIPHPVTGELVTIPGLQPTPVTVYITLLTSMFMHGGWAHLLGNMLFLWIFGDNVEDALGKGRYLAFYLLVGILASLAHVATTYLTGMDPDVPSLGASGAISGVLGAYLLLFPRKRVTVLLFRFLTDVPAFVAIGMWFLFQIINSLGALGDRTGGGVAYGAHIGGFIAGLVLVKAFATGRPPIDPRYQRPPNWPGPTRW